MNRFLVFVARTSTLILAAFAASTLLTGCSGFKPAVDLYVGPPGELQAGSASWGSEHSLRSGLSYVVTFPGAYDDEPSREWPLIVFLHSMDERGRRVARLYNHAKGQGLGLAGFALQQENFPFVTLSPLCPERNFWFFLHKRLYYLIDEVATLHRIDRDRVYLSGVSMGGIGTWSMAMAYPELFAAAAPIAGGVYTPPMRRRYSRITDIPFWAFHDRNDPSIPAKRDTRAVKALTESGGDARLTLLDTGRHYIHERVFREGAVFDWFLEHSR